MPAEFGFFLKHEVPIELIDRDFVFNPLGTTPGYFEDADFDASVSARRGKTQPGRGK